MRRAIVAVALFAVLGDAGSGLERRCCQAATLPRSHAAAWYLVGEDGAVLAQESSRRSRAIASITKLMTAIVALEEARPSDLVRVSSERGRHRRIDDLSARG